MSTEENKQETQQTSAEKQKSSQKSVMNYMLVLFAAAFCLLILTLLMEQRTNDELVDQIYAQVDYAQTNHNTALMQRDELQVALNNALEDNVDLRVEFSDTVSAYEKQISDLETELETANNLVTELQATLRDLNPPTETTPAE